MDANRERDGCQVDLGLDLIQSGKPHSQKRLLFEGDLQVVKRSMADADKGDGVSQVPHALGEVRHLGCGATTPDNRGHPTGRGRILRVELARRAELPMIGLLPRLVAVGARSC